MREEMISMYEVGISPDYIFEFFTKKYSRGMYLVLECMKESKDEYDKRTGVYRAKK